MAEVKQADQWTSEAYQSAAAFVPKLATKVVEWLDVQPDDKILDIGCGDGMLTRQIAAALEAGNGTIHGIDSSPSMIQAASSLSEGSRSASYAVLDATQLIKEIPLQGGSYSKVFSNAALHWILRAPASRKDVFVGAYNALCPGGTLVFEMGGMGNVAEMRAALLAAVARRIGIDKAREADPWFFPDQLWVREVLDAVGFTVEKIELEYRPTRAQEGPGGGIEGWILLMGKQFFDAVPAGEGRESAVREVVDTLKTITPGSDGGNWIGYVRLRVKARKL